jgi:hypothetical protein
LRDSCASASQRGCGFLEGADVDFPARFGGTGRIWPDVRAAIMRTFKFLNAWRKIMSRKVFDIITSTFGVAVVIALVVAGGLLTWGHSFVNSNVHNQLAQQQIYFPPKAAFDHPKAGTEITPSMIGPVSQFAGQQLLTGQQAKVYANDFIAVHLSEMPYGGVYSKISAASLKDPSNTKLAGVVQTVFRGTTLRGLLLEAYAFSEIGVVMLWGAIASFILAAVMSVLVGLGFWHARRTSEEEQMIVPKVVPASS